MLKFKFLRQTICGLSFAALLMLYILWKNPNAKRFFGMMIKVVQMLEMYLEKCLKHSEYNLVG